MPLTSAERTSLIKLASQIPTGSPERKVILDHIVKQAGAKVSPEETAWLKGELQALVKRLGGRVLRDAGSTLEFTYPDNPAVKKVTISQIGQPHVLYLIENQEGVQGSSWLGEKVWELPNAISVSEILKVRDPIAREVKLRKALKLSLETALKYVR